MDVIECKKIKRNLIDSKDIFNLLANLYVLCSSRFTVIYNLTTNNKNYSEKFRGYLRRYKIELLQILKTADDIFRADFSQITGIIEKMEVTDEEEFLIAVWAYLRAVDLSLSEDTIYLNTFTSIPCKASDCFDAKVYRLLFKPRNLIFDTIKDESPGGDELKININIGQRIEDRLENLIFYEPHLSRKIEIKEIDPVVNELLSAQGKNLAFAVAPIYFDYEYTFKKFEMPDGAPYVFKDIKNRPTISSHIKDVLTWCLENDVHIVVFPELSIDEKLRGRISDWLKLNNSNKTIIMVIAGSYHFQGDDERETYKNTSVVFGFDGAVLWEQEKMHQFQMDAGDIKQLRESPLKGFEEFRKLFGKSDKRAWEKIEISDTLLIYDSSIGRMAVTICLDYFVKERTDLLVEPHVNLVFVPTMSPTIDRMKRANFDSGTFGLASVFCTNSCWIITGGEIDKFDGEHSSFIYVPKKEELRQTRCTGDCRKCDFPILRISEIFKKWAAPTL